MPGETPFVGADVSNRRETEALAKTTHDTYGRIDGLVNNAAVHAELQYIPFDRVEEEEWDRVFAVNVKGTWLMTRAVYPFMKEQGAGKIVNIGSGTPFKGMPKMYHYVVSKGAIMTLTRVMARTLGQDGICVNCISPSLTRSDSVVAFREAVTPVCSPDFAATHADILRRPVPQWGSLPFLNFAHPPERWVTCTPAHSTLR